ncbi:MAG TPA: protein-glutamate O-methyltransferase CheR [Gemmatimonadales bacterium]|nr:protein-glutamate O-methyltransferase CheR [Gemmatimonadales bacterium]
MSSKDWSEIGFARMAAILTEQAGLQFPLSRRPYTEQAMRQAMSRLGADDSRAFAARLPDDRKALSELLAAVTIGETYFFREPSQLEYIRRTVLPALTGSRQPGHALRVWSAGCATGEEPYTLAIILREDLPNHEARIIGTELSHDRIAAARRARYGRWSLRSLSEPVIRRYFSQRGSHYYLRPDIRAMVDFGYLNLASNEYPGGPLNLRGMDLILCRNVLIYFDRQAVADVAQRLLNSLGDDGWLFLGASDPSLVDLVRCEVVVTGAGLASRRPSAKSWSLHAAAGAMEPVSAIASVVAQGMYTTLQDGAPDAWSPTLDGSLRAIPEVAAAAGVAAAEPVAASAQVASPPVFAGGLEEVRSHYALQDYAGAIRVAVQLLNSGTENAELRVLLVRSLANSGSLPEAGRACIAGIEAHPTHAELAYLHALLLSEAGRVEESIVAARGALFLDRKLVVAHMLLGGLLARMNDSVAARRSFQNAQRLLEGVPRDATVAASDGEPAGRIREAARVQADLLVTNK